MTPPKDPNPARDSGEPEFGAEFEVVESTPDPIRVLLIEDDPDHAALVEAYLADVQGPAVRLARAGTVAEGAEALAEARASGEPFHVVLADQQLPDSAYWETVGRVAEASGAAPVVALTSLGDLDVALDAVRMGASDYLIKSELTPEILRRTLRYAVERARRDEALRATNEALRQTVRHVRQMQSQMVEQEKLAGLGRLLSGVAHELRNPLGLALGAVEAVSGEADAILALLPDAPEAVRDHLATLRAFAGNAVRNGRRADAVVQAMYAHARGVEGEVRPVALAEVVRAAVAQVPTGGVVLRVDARDVTVHGSGSALTRMLANVIENAVLAARAGGGSVRVHAGPAEDGAAALVRVEDDGPGMAPALAEAAFEPFRSAWGEGPRIGLGLTIARAIAVGHGGRIELGPSPLGGLRVRIGLPAPEAADEPVEA